MAESNGTPEWRKALRDVTSVAVGSLILIHEAFVDVPDEKRLYIGAVLLVGPAFLRSLGK